MTWRLEKHSMPYFELTRSYFIDAAHMLEGLAPAHPCARLHGHRFRIDVVIAGEPDAQGMVLDFHEMDRRMAPLLEQLDHNCLNDVEGLEQPTAENLALWISTRFDPAPARFVSVSVWETERSRATLRLHGA